MTLLRSVVKVNFMKKLCLYIFLVLTISCSGEKSKKSAYDVNIGDKIDSILSQTQIELYYWKPETEAETVKEKETFGKDKKYSLVTIPGETNIFSNKFDYVQLVYNNDNLLIEHVGVITQMNINTCLKERAKQMNIYIDKFDLKDSNIFKKEIKTLDKDTNIIARRLKIGIPNKMSIFFTCYDVTNYKGSKRIKSDYRFEKFSRSYANWVRKFGTLFEISN